jgi:adenylylsulfate reductase subunit A
VDQRIYLAGIPEYFWGYNRMMTVDGLFAAGDAAGGTAHAFSSGSFTEGRLCAKAAVQYINDGKANGIKVTEAQCEKFKEEIYKPLENYTVGRNEITAGNCIPKLFITYTRSTKTPKNYGRLCGRYWY